MFDQEENVGDEFFDVVDTISAGGQRLPYLVPGQFLLQIDKIIFMISRPPKRAPMYIVEFTILDSNAESRPVGMQVSWATKLNIDMGPINMKRFVGAAAGYGLVEEIDANVDSAICKYSRSKDQPFTGVQVHCQVSMTTTKEGKPFSEHRYSPVQGYSWNDLNPATASDGAAA